MKKLLLLLILTLAAPALRPVVNAAPMHNVELAEQSVKVRVVHGGLELTNNSDQTLHFQIYSITGQMVKSLDLGTGSVTVDLPQGCYIVKHPKGTQKAVVR